MALKDPLNFVEKLRKGAVCDLPKRRKLPTMPVINWDKYDLGPNSSEKQESRKRKLGVQGKYFYMNFCFGFS